MLNVRNVLRKTPFMMAAVATLSMSLTSSSSLSAPSAKNLCVDIFAARTVSAKSATLSIKRAKSATLSIKRAKTNYERILAYPKGVDPEKMPGGHFEVAYESEYTFDESGPLLRDYYPAKEMSKEQWLALSDADHIQWLKEKYKDKPEHAEGSGLKKIVDLAFMPEELLIDSTGNAEIVLERMSTEGEWQKTIDIIVNRYGAGSQQAMISKPRQSAFPVNATPEQMKRMVQQHKGWQIYTNLFDMYGKMKSGYERFEKDPTKLTAMSFEHPFVGPMIKIKRDIMEVYMEKNAQGLNYDEDAKRFVRKSDASFKYTSGPSYRPDIAGPYRWAWELRNSHKDLQDLKDKVHRDIVAHQKGLEAYEVFGDVPAFDSIATFDALPMNLKTMLKTVIPSKADPRFEYDEDQIRSLETYRNFSIPMQDMTSLVMALAGKGKAGKQLLLQTRQAQGAYLARMNETATELAANRINKMQAKAKLMGAIGEFAVKSGLSEAFVAKAIAIGHDGGDLDAAQTRPLAGMTPAQ